MSRRPVMILQKMIMNALDLIMVRTPQMIRVRPAPSGGRIQPPVRRLVIMIGVLLSLGALVSCVSVPTSGKVEQADQGPQRNDTKPESIPKPPVKDASPRTVVEGFLFAMSQYQTNYEVARQYLTEDARQSWRPEDKISIYSNPKYDNTDSNVTLTMTQVGEVDADGSYSARSGSQLQDFAMQQNADGQWRISNPPDGLLISDTSFSANFTSFNLYYFDPQFMTLVPDPIYLPTNGRTATALVQTLLRGPTTWMQPAVSTAFPPRTSLVGNSVPVQGELAQIALSPGMLTLNDQQRTRMAAQLAWTLSQIQDTPLEGFQLTVNGERYRVPRQIGEGQSAYVPLNYGSEYSPVPAQLSSNLLGVNDGAVVLVDNDGARLSPISGRLGRRNYAIDSLGVSTDGQTVAAVTDDRTTLRTQMVEEESPRTVLYDQTDLLRPEYTRYDELWAVSGRPGKQTVRMFKDNRPPVTINAPWAQRLTITAFQISPDGSRMALIAKVGTSQILAVAPIQRGETISLGNVRAVELVDVASSPVQRIADVGWTSPTRLLILGASGEGASFEPYGVEIDGSQFERVGTSDNWGATSLATLPESAGSFRAVVSGRAGRVWSYQSGDQWKLLSEDLRYPSYGG